MRASRPPIRRGLILGTLWAFWVVGLLVGPARVAPADCSHPERPGFGIAPIADPSDVDRPRDPRIGPTAPEAPRPCTGPQCSGKSAPAPASAALPRIAPAADSWACLAAMPGGAQTRSTFDRPDDPAVFPAHAPPSIFHPPRRPR